MFTFFLTLVSAGFLSILVIYFFTWIFIRSIYERFTVTMNGYSSLRTELCLLNERIKNLLDESDKKSFNTDKVESDEREERWNRIRKAFEKKEKEQDGSH